jgi:hypothetical protein
MYLLPAGTGARTVNKWGMGNLYTRVPRSKGLRGFGAWKSYRRGAPRLPGALGDVSPDCPGSVVDPITGELCPTTAVGPGGSYIPGSPDYGLPGVAAAPSQPGVNPAVQQAYQNLLTQQQNSKDPLDYVSPQAAIAAGLPSQAVYNAWSASLAKFPTQNAALAAGIPAGVVTQLWAPSRAAASAPTTSLFAGVSTTTLLFAGGAVLLLPMLLGGRRR